MGVIEFPKIPQTVKIYSTVTPGTRFVFNGKCEEKTFSFALVSTSNIALLLEFDLENDKLVRAKSFFKGIWSAEKISKNPVRANTDFFIQIVVSREKFEVFSDGNHIVSLKQTVPLDEVNGIRLMETMELRRIEMDQQQYQ
ncbi:unnamed protein product [Caenorhabditis sp. 36 PRJEB53466]|nr:unnamed protein product [Caenorhabditis sp. 36 PRJEB53466]